MTWKYITLWQYACTASLYYKVYINILVDNKIIMFKKSIIVLLFKRNNLYKFLKVNIIQMKNYILLYSFYLKYTSLKIYIAYREETSYSVFINIILYI